MSRKRVVVYAVIDRTGWVWWTSKHYHEGRGHLARWAKWAPKMGPWKLVRCVEAKS